MGTAGDEGGAATASRVRWLIRVAISADGNVIDLHFINGGLRHFSESGIDRILYDGQPSALLHRPEARAAVVHRSTQEHSNNLGTEGRGGRTEERIDGRPAAIFSRPANDGDLLLLHKEMMIGRSDVNFAPFDRLTMDGMIHFQGTNPSQNFWKKTFPSRPDMQHDEIEAGKLAGSWAKTVFIASIPPAEAPITTISRNRESITSRG